jgi:threonine dehydratase
MTPPPVTFAAIEHAAARIAPFTHRTPIFTSATLDAETGAEVFCKAENLQKVGAFKARGATNAVQSLPPERAASGVVTHSSGNHGQALAYAAATRQIPAWIVMPDNANPIKVAAVEAYGGIVVFCRHDEREAAAERVRMETGAALIHPFEDPTVIAGQGTAALELVEAVPDLDVVIAPIGGGGLLSGTALVCRERLPHGEVVGAEPLAVDDAFRSLQTGIRQPGVENPATLADGLLTGIGALPFAILSRLGADVVTVSEEAIVAAAQFHLSRMKLLVEPSAATPLAALRTQSERFRGRRVGLILSGGNTDLAWLPR